ncbi:MAG: SRPBCC domain-containing protein [Pseudomonadales bacterium]|jgi:uncharacterized protein YndB with AHSA1/START domain|nr:SRPBCC domain-containing protein [Pseudomonadales bacterium]MDP7357612.1 SRPBCC domain-containing protein [Pseudomonadales bacterium]MDP7595035.1 SRPBCC domain-containing protein [Pseudomonadales bacterium]HJN51408.1 SRPBCC domain-containing protein [Pseudomonadales bacterium]|tara:strand:- start:3167 stop:3670 length:504 start_codon:yes stop_codon:yes gene_type:complete
MATKEEKIEDVGTIKGIGKHRRVEVTRLFPFAIQDVWEAITEPENVAQWFGELTIDQTEGGRIKLGFGKTEVTGSIKTFMPPHVFPYTWEQGGESTSLVQVDLIETAADETLLTIVQSALDADVATDVGAGWHSMMDRLAQFLHTRAFAPQDGKRWEYLSAAYQALG